MFSFVFGMAGSFALWCERVTFELCRRGLEASELIRADTLEQVALSVMRCGASRAVVASHAPGGRLRAAIAEHRSDVIVVLEDPRTALVETVVGHGIPLAEAVQRLATSCAVLLPYRNASHALVLQSNRDRHKPAATIATIAEYLGLEIDEAEIADIIAVTAAGNPPDIEYDAVGWWQGLHPDERDMATGALAAYLDEPAFGAEAPVKWTSELFFLGEDLTRRLSTPADITGRVRCLVHGPYIMLPPGSWSLSLAARLSLEASEHTFGVEVWAGRLLASGTTRIWQHSAAVIELDFTIEEATEHPIGIRISSLRAAFDGAITGAEVILVPKLPGEDEAPLTALSAEA